MVLGSELYACLSLTPPSLFRFFFRGKAYLVARRQGHGAQKASAGKEFHPETPPCFRRIRRAHRAPGRAPLQGDNFALEKRSACPSGPRNEGRLMVFARNALASGPGTASNSILLTPTRRKVKGGKMP